MFQASIFKFYLPLSTFHRQANMSPIITIDHLVKRYKKAQHNAVDDISFTVGEGEFFTLLGPNGAGKTTTISILTTTLSKTSGKVEIAGYDLDKKPSEVRQRIGVIFQNPSLDKNLTAEENIRFHSILYNLYPFRPSFSLMPKAYQTRVKELASILQIEKDIFKPIKTFSGGMKRKLEIIRSLMHHPKILFLDEPSSGLDPITRKNLWDYLEDVRKKQNTTIFLTTHYLEEAEDSTHIGIINHGKIISFGTPSDLKKNLIEEYLLIDSNNRKKLLEELKEKKFEYEEAETIRVQLGKYSVQEAISHIKTPLSILKIHTPTLEEAYVEIIGEAKDETS